MEKDFLKEEGYLKAQKRVKEIKGFYWHLFWFVFTNIVWFGIIIYLNEEQSFYDYGFWGKGYGIFANLLFWGIGLFFHWFMVFGRRLTVSQSWEERKIKQFIEEDKNSKY